VSNTPGPPSQLENRSNWGPMASPHHLLRHPDEVPPGAEEVGPPAPQPTPDDQPLDPLLPKPESPKEKAPPTPLLNEPSVLNSVRSATKTRNASTRRSATKSGEGEEREAPPPVQSASRRPAVANSRYSGKENLPANYESRGGKARQRDIEPAGYSDLRNEGVRGPRGSAPAGARREP
jgi:hypothetical protein